MIDNKEIPQEDFKTIFSSSLKTTKQPEPFLPGLLGMRRKL